MAQVKRGTEGDADQLEALVRRVREKVEVHGGAAVVAAKTGISAEAVRGWLRGGAREAPRPSVSALRLLAERFRVNPTFLLLGEGPEYLGSASRSTTDLAADVETYVVERVARETEEPEAMVRACLDGALSALEGAFRMAKATVRLTQEAMDLPARLPSVEALIRETKRIDSVTEVPVALIGGWKSIVADADKWGHPIDIDRVDRARVQKPRRRGS